MSNPAKGARLYFREPSQGRKGVWIIRDGSVSNSTGFARHDLGKAEEALERYIAQKHSPDRSERHPSQILIADVLSIYAADVAPKHGRPHETAARLARLRIFWADRRLSAVNGRECRAYVKFVRKEQAARRDLEDFRAAIVHHRREGYCSEVIEIVLPKKAQPRDRWLTRSEAAALLWAAWKGGQGKRRHVARFILVGLYTGTRAGAICGAAMAPAVGRGHVDLERGVFYRRAPGSLETKKRQPPIRISGRLLAHMRRWQAKGLAKVSVVQVKRRNPKTGELEDSPVSRVSKGFRGAAKAAGLSRVTPHTLRHTAATWAMQGGADLWETAGYLGMTVQMLEERYGHHRPDHGAGVERAINSRPHPVCKPARKPPELVKPET